MKNINLNEIINTDALSGLKNLPDERVDCCITSPPYWGLRDYDLKPISWPWVNYTIFGFNIDIPEWSGQLGLEPTPEMFVGHIVLIFREVKRVLKTEGTLWLNFGDTYYGGKGKNGASWDKLNNNQINNKAQSYCKYGDTRPQDRKNSILKPKDLVGIPWMVAFALRDDGWYLRQDIIWHKRNPMPESINDRCTKAHEYIFLLSKSKKYYFDADSIKTDSKNPFDDQDRILNRQKESYKNNPDKLKNGIRIRKPAGWDIEEGSLENFHKDGRSKIIEYTDALFLKANKRSVWNEATEQFSEAHFATFSQKLIIDCIKAGTSEKGYCAKCGKPYVRIVKKELIPTKKASFKSMVDKRDLLADKNDQGSNRMKDGHKPGWINKTETTGWKPSCDCNVEIVPGIVLDPFMGTRTTKIVARKLNRNCIGFELSEEYMKIGEKREYKELGMFK